MSAPWAEVIGDPIRQSKSPLIHGFWIEHMGLNACYRAHHVCEEELADYLAERRKDTDWRGCNVTMPHKQAIMPLLDEISPEAAKIGAVNTVVRQPDGSLMGFNTDAAGFREPLVEHGDYKRNQLFRMARVIGTGGAARAILQTLVEDRFTIVLAGRNPENARALLDEFDPQGHHFNPPLSHFGTATDFEFDDREGIFDLVVNASPLGMRGQPPLLFDLSHAPPGAVVYDIVTDPVETPLIQAARAAGHPVIDGLAMLIGQAARAFEMFFGQAPPRDKDHELRERLQQ
ncbi:MAG: shikimate dehydrogenase [Erythrobacter sp.]